MSLPSSIPIYIIDAFAAEKFTGNQAAVCLLNKVLTDEQYQKIGAEFNLAETAFPIPLDADDYTNARRFSLRWFTPAVEVPLCGHATLATAHAILNETGNKNKTIEFETKSGRLEVKRSLEIKGYLTMNFPTYPMVALDADNWPKGLRAESFEKTGVAPEFVKKLATTISCGHNILAIVHCPTAPNLIVMLDNMSRQEFESIKPPIDKLIDIYNGGDYLKGIIITMRCSETSGLTDCNERQYDFASRYFCPWFFDGFDEDPATGYAHCCVTPFWGKVFGKNKFYARQCYPGRGAEFHLELCGNGRLNLTGQAITVIRGEMIL
uniref:Uncharacterized protein n=1 Tax=Plectus sambesii TaxID=2011161 RepID=A0A914W1K1_9BILA